MPVVTVSDAVTAVAVDVLSPVNVVPCIICLRFCAVKELRVCAEPVVPSLTPMLGYVVSVSICPLPINTQFVPSNTNVDGYSEFHTFDASSSFKTSPL